MEAATSRSPPTAPAGSPRRPTAPTTRAAARSTATAPGSPGGTAGAGPTDSPGPGGGGADNGDRTGFPWGDGGGWADATPDTFPDWLEVDFAGEKTIDEIDVFSVQDAYQTPGNPALATTFSLYGLRDFEV